MSSSYVPLGMGGRGRVLAGGTVIVSNLFLALRVIYFSGQYVRMCVLHFWASQIYIRSCPSVMWLLFLFLSLFFVCFSSQVSGVLCWAAWRCLEVGFWKEWLVFISIFLSVCLFFLCLLCVQTRCWNVCKCRWDCPRMRRENVSMWFLTLTRALFLYFFCT